MADYKTHRGNFSDKMGLETKGAKSALESERTDNEK